MKKYHYVEVDIMPSDKRFKKPTRYIIGIASSCLDMAMDAIETAQWDGFNVATYVKHTAINYASLKGGFVGYSTYRMVDSHRTFIATIDDISDFNNIVEYVNILKRRLIK